MQPDASKHRVEMPDHGLGASRQNLAQWGFTLGQRDVHSRTQGRLAAQPHLNHFRALAFGDVAQDGGKVFDLVLAISVGDDHLGNRYFDAVRSERRCFARPEAVLQCGWNPLLPDDPAGPVGMAVEDLHRGERLHRLKADHLPPGGVDKQQVAFHVRDSDEIRRLLQNGRQTRLRKLRQPALIGAALIHAAFIRAWLIHTALIHATLIPAALIPVHHLTPPRRPPPTPHPRPPPPTPRPHPPPPHPRPPHWPLSHPRRSHTPRSHSRRSHTRRSHTRRAHTRGAHWRRSHRRRSHTRRSHWRRSRTRRSQTHRSHRRRSQSVV